jgi:hypothetical protein
MPHSFSNSVRQLVARTVTVAAALVSVLTLGGGAALAQNPQVEEKLTAIREKMAQNKQQLAQYTWQETETIAIKGEVKDTKLYQVQMGPAGQQKTLITNEQAQSGGREGLIKKHVVEKKTEEYKEYGQEIGALAKQYTTPDPSLLMQAKQQGNVSIQLGGNGTVSLVIRNYIKPGDQMALTIDDQTKAPITARIQTYLSDPSDAVNISADFAQLPDGTNHVANATINGVSKQLTLTQQNSEYRKLM